VDTNEDIVYKEITNYTNVIKLKNTGKYVFSTRCKCDNQLGGTQPPLEVTGEWKHITIKWTERREKMAKIELVQ
jgi:hypothetical protein